MSEGWNNVAAVINLSSSQTLLILLPPSANKACLITVCTCRVCNVIFMVYVSSSWASVMIIISTCLYLNSIYHSPTLLTLTSFTILHLKFDLDSTYYSIMRKKCNTSIRLSEWQGTRQCWNTGNICTKLCKAGL